MKIASVDIWTVVVPTIPGRVHSPEWVEETGWDQVPKHVVRLNTRPRMRWISCARERVIGTKKHFLQALPWAAPLWKRGGHKKHSRCSKKRWL